MAIVKMSKFSLLALNSERDHLLHELQNFKYVHFHNLNENDELKEMGLQNIEVPESITAINEDINKVSYAIEVLSKHGEKKAGLTALKDGIESYEFKELEQRALAITYQPVYEEVRRLDQKNEAANKEIDTLKSQIQELSPWRKLNIEVEQLSSLTQCETYLGTIPKKLREKLEMDLKDAELTYLEVVHEDQDNTYLFILTHRLESEFILDQLKKYSFTRISLAFSGKPEEEITVLEEKISRLQSECETVENNLQELAEYIHDFELVYEYLMNKKIRVAAAENFLQTEFIDVIEGYIPTDMEDEFKQTVKKELHNVYHLELEEAKEDDPNVPILLKNSKFSNSFESLTKMYALPKYNEIDPTPLFSVFYAVFFGMMVADLGYGLLMLIGTFAVLKLFNLTESQKRTIRFYYYLSYSTIIWGAIYGSFLGGVVELPALINPSEDYNMLLVISIALGIVHIFYALGIQAYMYIKDGKPLDALFDVGFWYMALGGAIFYLAAMFVPSLSMGKNIALAVMIIGMAGIVLTGGRDAKGIGGKIGGGLYSLYGISGYVGDFVSYSRLMALGLSGGFIASAINMMVRMLFRSGILGGIFGILVFIIGQGFNIFLSILSGYVHTIRLTYVEFFGKFYEGGGKAFRLFRSEPKYIDIK